MGLRKILTDKEPSLHKVCRPVEKFDGKLHKLLDDMVETMMDAHGVGLAAPQVGILRRIVVVNTGDDPSDNWVSVNKSGLYYNGEQLALEEDVSNSLAKIKEDYLQD